MQFHPTTLYPSGILITEGCRGEGALPDQQGRRALHGALRAERARARLARCRLPLGADRDRRGPRRQRLGHARHAAPRRRANHRAAPGLARARDHLCRRRPDLRAGTGASRAPTTTWAASTPTSTGSPSSTGLYAAGETHASRCTARTGSAATRSWRRSCSAAAPDGPPPSGRSRSTTVERARNRPSATPSASSKQLLDRESGERPWKIRDELGDVDARELRRLPPRGQDDPAGSRSSTTCASATSASSSRTRATSSTAT